MEQNPVKGAIEVICVNLPVLRSIYELTQNDLALIVGTSRQTIINFEHQEKKISKSMLISIITYFSLKSRSASFLKSLSLYKNPYVNSLGFTEDLCNYIIENTQEK